MKVLHVSVMKSFAPQGVAKLLDSIALSLKEYGHEVLRESKDYKPNKSDSTHVNSKKSLREIKFIYVIYFLYRASIIVRKVKGQNYNELVCHDVFVLFWVKVMRIKGKISYYNHSDGDPIETLKIGAGNFLDNLVINLVKQSLYKTRFYRIYSLSDSASREIHKVLRYAPKQFKVMNNFSEDNLVEQETTDKCCNPSKNVWLIGTVCSRKRQVQYIESFARQKAELPFKFKLLGVCNPEDRNKLIKTGLVESVQCVEDVKPLLACGDILLSLSENEGLPISMIEAISKGVSLITTDVGGCKEICIDGYNGVLLGKSPSPSEVVEALIKVYNSDELSQLYSKNSILLHEKKFSPSAFLAGWE